MISPSSTKAKTPLARLRHLDEEGPRQSVTDYAFHCIITDLGFAQLEEMGQLIREGVKASSSLHGPTGVFMLDDAYHLSSCAERDSVMMQWIGVVGDGFVRGLSSSRCRRPGGGFWPLYWMAKSMSVVVPRRAAAIVPVWESSALVCREGQCPDGCGHRLRQGSPAAGRLDDAAGIFSVGSWAAMAVTFVSR